jgi:hypothetical protein
MKPTTTLLSILLAVLAVAGVPRTARADDTPDPDMQAPPTKSPSREGPTISISVGPGELHILPDASMAKETRVEGAGFSLRAGLTLSQVSTFDLVVDFIDSGGGPSSTRSTVVGGSLKFYTADPLYLRVGGGLGMLSQPGVAPIDSTVRRRCSASATSGCSCATSGCSVSSRSSAIACSSPASTRRS